MQLPIEYYLVLGSLSDISLGDGLFLCFMGLKDFLLGPQVMIHLIMEVIFLWELCIFMSVLVDRTYFYPIVGTLVLLY